MYEIFNQTKENIPIEKLKELLKFTLEKEKLNNVYFNIIFVDNAEIWKINKEYRGVDRPTDVISFALEDNYKQEFEFGRLLGDIYISVEKAKEQAKEYNHSELREYAFLTIHGLFHLLGYDHIKKEDEKIMFKKQEEVLNEFKITE